MTVSKLVAAAPSNITATTTAALPAATTATTNTANTSSSSGSNRGGINNTEGGNPEMKAALVLLNMVLNGTANSNATDNSTGNIPKAGGFRVGPLQADGICSAQYTAPRGTGRLQLAVHFTCCIERHA